MCCALQEGEVRRPTRPPLCPAGPAATPPRSMAALAWRLAFLCLCLPACYPCYLSRSLRQSARPRPRGPTPARARPLVDRAARRTGTTKHYQVRRLIHY